MVSETAAKKSALSEIVRVFFNGSPASAASALLGMSDRLKDKELDELEQMIARARQAKGAQIMHVLIGIALKSLLIAGLTLGLLAADEAALGRRALVGCPYRPARAGAHGVRAARPAELDGRGPALLGSAPADESAAGRHPLPAAVARKRRQPQRSTAAAATVARSRSARPRRRWHFTPFPAAILLFITFLALARLIALRARADVLVDGHWLSALARAQRRMGFKHGTALLTSDELASPISWGLMRPVILLNTRAVEASGEAEAIIAHELAHVARMDWVKLLLARVATALFWFNPLVWVLAREAHQLREETADDAVLAADISDTDYAQLLVGVARHECPGLLLGAHGVAPSKSSLARRVARVLDGKSVRGPVARSFAAGVFVGAVLVAAPLAALTLAPGGHQGETEGRSRRQHKTAPQTSYYAAASDPEVPTDLGSIIADGVSTSVTLPSLRRSRDVRPSTAALRSGGCRSQTRSRSHRRQDRSRSTEAGVQFAGPSGGVIKTPTPAGPRPPAFSPQFSPPMPPPLLSSRRLEPTHSRA